MENPELARLAESLHALQEQALAKLMSQSEHMDEESISAPDLTDRAAQEAERNFTLIMRERDLQAYRDVQSAISRLHAGEYGICEECGEDISMARLKAYPMATLCVHCKSRREDEERARALGASVSF
ncbi:RNA polymerase-binding protein DksA [Fundidesulfovibrio butyratiphilus]